MTTLEIDGSYLEGGGQIVRTAIALSAISGKSVHICNIRKGREKPGLKPQHLTGISAAAKMCGATVEGVHKDSTAVFFNPGKIKGGKYQIDTGTAGSITLVLQTLVPMCLYADTVCEISVKGGTAVPFSPTTEYFQNVLCYYLRKMGVTLDLETKLHGFYPAGGGEATIRLKPAGLSVIDIPRPGELVQVDVNAMAADHLRESRVCERLIMGFQQSYPKANFKYRYVKTGSPGCFIGSHAHFSNAMLGADALGKKGKRAEEVGKDAARELIEMIASGAAVDRWMTDQLIPYVALAAFERGESCAVKIPGLSRHAETNIWVTKQFLPVNFEIKDNILTCA